MQRVVFLLWTLGSVAHALHNCYQCTHTRDSANETYGVGQSECWDSDNVGVGMPCNTEEEICLTRILVQWNGAGHQLAQISRGCGAPPDDHCHSASFAGIQSAECHFQCQEDMCNDAASVDETSNMFNPAGPKVGTCEACNHYENANGNVNGNVQCKEASSTNMQPCPAYANKACYIATSVSYDKEDNQETATDRGCSAFIMDNNDGYECNTLSSNGVPMQTCKETCQSEDCNTQPPSYEIETEPQNTCLACSVTVDQYNNTIGAGSIGCWTGSPAYAVQCRADEECLTMMEVDWVAKGAHQYTVRRRCTPKSSPEPPCLEGSTSLIKYKDCYSQCDPKSSRPNCNDGLDEVANKFYSAAQNVQTCYDCQYFELDDGQVSGYEKCAEQIMIDNPNGIPVRVCPRYASKTCYEASSTHMSYSGENKLYEEDYRGCSPFGKDYGCADMEIDGLAHANCKNTCETNNCNKDAHQTRHQCYSCMGVRDNSGASAGVSDERCWDPEQLTDRMLMDCGVDENFCMDHVTVDWFGNGQQVAIIQRGCSTRPAKDTCIEDKKDPLYAYVDCEHSCDANTEGGCNKDMTAAEKNKGGQTSCYTCYDRFHADGSVEGFANCPDEQGSSGNKADCPTWASNGCYISAAAHYVQGQNRVDAYRGCSAFQLDNHGDFADENCYGGNFPDIDGIPQQFNMCKATCDGTNCNKQETVNPNVDSAVPLCQICQVTVDQYNRTTGTGDPACWLGDKKFMKECPNPTDKCITEMEADWYPRGMIQYRMKRGCGEKAPETCVTGSTSLLAYKDCAVDCDPNGNSGCNDGIDEVAEKFAQFNKNVDSCYTCQYLQNQDGQVQGHSDCKRNPERVGSRACPLYAQAACMEAASFHRSYEQGSMLQVEDDFRGCSPFKLEDDNVCKTAEVDGITHRNCKNTCDRSNCNNEMLSSGHSCYSCAATRDSSGNPVGTGDDRCFDSVHENDALVQDCQPGEDFCVDELLVDWLPKGDQYATIRRGCSSRQPADSCTENSSMALLKYKDCFHYCRGNACNWGMEAADGFLPNKHNASTGVCWSCRYVEHDSGEAEGNTQCMEKLEGDLEDLKHQCGIYQHVGCFTASTKHIGYEGSDLEGQEVSQVYKGCSSFVIPEGFEFEDTMLPGENGEDTGYVISRSTCLEDECNAMHIDISGKPPTVSCLQCQVTVDMKNRTIGIGDYGCWLGDRNMHTAECPHGQQYCATDLLVDWLAKGEIQYRVKRGCSSVPPQALTECETGSATMIQYKDCQVTCEGDACNTGLDQVARKFGEDGHKPIDSCYECKYQQEATGDINGLPTCAAGVETSGLEARSCPMYANAACYYSSATHLNYNSIQESFEDDYRGCAPFEYARSDEEWHCENVNVNGYRHEVCKGSCNSTDCNGQQFAEPKNMCFVCSVTLNSEGDVVFGSRDCWRGNAGATDLQSDCHNDEPYCIDEIEVDWYGVGYQYTTLKRGCSKEPARNLCEQAESSRIKYKDCFHSCKIEEEGNICNNNVTNVQQKFLDPDGFRQNECFACYFNEDDFGQVSGNENCRDLDQAGPEIDFDPLTHECELHLSMGCYTGAAIHDVSGTDKEEVYKGCSAFYIPDPFFEMTTDVLPNNQTYNLAKETCRGPLCNFKTRHPWPSGEEETTTSSDSSTETTTTTTTTTTTAGSDATTIIISISLLLLSVLLF